MINLKVTSWLFHLGLTWNNVLYSVPSPATKKPWSIWFRSAMIIFHFIFNKLEVKIPASLCFLQQLLQLVVSNPVLLLLLPAKYSGHHHLNWIHELWVVMPVPLLKTCLMIPNSTSVIVSCCIFLSCYAIIIQFLQRSTNLILIHLQKSFVDLLCPNEV